ncbi:MAG: hypothetical protein A3F67_08610 [Verrucomicrobia bacterium RIFCSPHIGHO2_12_FULL_41_10]|nr:MAG: hypothetical protein A3F67_08610 [Verrucomicrobia bacterium RIFCSPHIGHO2_12_FULL_41_10]HLB33584.1 hypothetical protein [Chthoniobacterales bacterium]
MNFPLNTTFSTNDLTQIISTHYAELAASTNAPSDDSHTVHVCNGQLTSKEPYNSTPATFSGHTIQFLNANKNIPEQENHRAITTHFIQTVRETFGNQIVNYVFPLKEQEQHLTNALPLTLHQIRSVLTKANEVNTFITQYIQERSELKNLELTKNMAFATFAQTEADQAAEAFKALGTPQQHLEETVDHTMNFVASCGLTAGAVTAAGLSAATGLILASHCGPVGYSAIAIPWSVSILLGNISNRLRPDDSTLTRALGTGISMGLTSSGLALLGAVLAPPMAQLSTAGSVAMTATGGTLALSGISLDIGVASGRAASSALPNPQRSFTQASESAVKVSQSLRALATAIQKQKVANSAYRKVFQLATQEDLTKKNQSTPQHSTLTIAEEAQKALQKGVQKLTKLQPPRTMPPPGRRGI